MEKFLSCSLLIFLFCSIVSAAWDDFSNNSPSANADSATPTATSNQTPATQVSDDSNQMGEMKFTSNFFIAIGVLAIGILIIIFLIFNFFKKPKNKWEK